MKEGIDDGRRVQALLDEDKFGAAKAERRVALDGEMQLAAIDPEIKLGRTAATRRGRSISAVCIERTAHLVPLGRVSARQRYLEPVSGFEPLTVRLQGGCSA